MAKNKVIAGDFNGYSVSSVFGTIVISGMLGDNKGIILNQDTVETYDVITDEHRKSAASGIARGAVGAALLGPIGLLAGLSAKDKSTFTVALKFKDGTNSLVEIDEKLYKAIVKNCF